jgi:hypothetical protein
MILFTRNTVIKWIKCKCPDTITERPCICITREIFGFTAKIQVEEFWVVTPCSVAIGYQRFGGLCCLHLQGGMFRVDESCEPLPPQRDPDARFEVFRTMKIQVEVFCVVMLCSVVGYQRFRRITYFSFYVTMLRERTDRLQSSLYYYGSLNNQTTWSYKAIWNQWKEIPVTYAHWNAT